MSNVNSDIQVNYLKLGDKVYAISEIQANGVDVNAELKEFYEQRHGQLAEEFGQVLNDGMQQEWDTQIAHLRKFEQRGAITVPESMFNKTIMAFNNKLMPVRIVIYSPDEVSASLSWLRSRCRNINYRLGVWRGFAEAQEVILTVKPLFAVPLVLCYDKQANQMYTPLLKTFHTMHGNNVCTGRHKASDFWKLSDENLNKEMNRINTFSPASSVVTIGNAHYDFNAIINNDTITAVREKGEFTMESVNVIEALNTVDYSRQSELDAVLTPHMAKNDIHIIVGCGGIGFWLGIQLAMLGYRHFILVDGESVDYSNLNRLPVPQTWVGTNKAVALRKVIRSMRLDTVVMALSTNIAKDTISILKNVTSRFNTLGSQRYYRRDDKCTLWDTTDDAKIQTELHKYAKGVSNMEYRKLGYEGFEIGCYKEYSVWTADDYTTGYRTSNANAVTSCISAGMGIFARCLTSEDMEIDLKKMIQTSTKKKLKNSDEVKRLTTLMGKYRQWIIDNCDNGEDDLADLDEDLKEEGLL